MDDYLKNLAERAVKATDWFELEGWLTHTTHAGGSPTCPVGTSIRVDSSFSDCIVEGKFGRITPMPSHYHPDFDALCEQHDRDIESAMARVLPDLSDAATIGCLLALVRKKHGLKVFVCPTQVNHNPWRVYHNETCIQHFADGKSEAEALVAALEAE